MSKANTMKNKSNLEITCLKNYLLNRRYLSFKENFKQIDRKFMGEIRYSKVWCHQTLLYLKFKFSIGVKNLICKLQQLFDLCEFSYNIHNWSLIYRSNANYYPAAEFHSKCDNLKNTLIIIKSGNFIFGGYTEQSWSCSDSLSIQKTWSKCFRIFSNK